MKRTPEPTLTQSKLTSMFQGRSGPETGGPSDSGPPAAPRMVTLDIIEMDTYASSNSSSATTVAMSVATTGSTPVTADFLLKALKEKSEHLIKSFNANLTALSTRIDGNAAQIVANTSAIADNAAGVESHTNEIRSLTDRIARLERAGHDVEAPTEQRATLEAGYLAARRSIRLWPIQGDTEDSVWEGVGDFLHEILSMREDEIGQEDIESIVRPVGGRDLVDRREVIDKFYDKQRQGGFKLTVPHQQSGQGRKANRRDPP